MVGKTRGGWIGGRSLRDRLLILLAIMILPFVGFSALKGQDINRSLMSEYQQSNLTLARSVAYSIDDYMLSTGELLNAISHSDAARDGDIRALNVWLTEVLPDYPHYSNIIYVDNDGFIRAAGKKSAEGDGLVNVTDTVYFKRSMESTGLAIGDFMYGKISGAPVVHICLPVYSRDGNRQGFVSAAMHLTRVQDRLMREKTPEHTTILVVDRAGVVLARNRDPEEWVGTNVFQQLRVARMIDQREGDDEAVLRNGEHLVCSYTAVDSVPWFVRVGINEEHIAATTAQELALHYAVFLPLLLVALGGWLWIGRDVDRLHKRTEQLSLIDPLTELWNSRSLRDDMTRSFEHALRAREHLSFMMIDLDDFKGYNDRYGHVAGDGALQETARTIKAAIRVVDRAYRYGGEEFCVLLPDTDSEAALMVAERVREAIASVQLYPENDTTPVMLSVSVGVATYPRDAQTPDEITKYADDALYRAKRAGKNRVVVHTVHVA